MEKRYPQMRIDKNKTKQTNKRLPQALFCRDAHAVETELSISVKILVPRVSSQVGSRFQNASLVSLLLLVTEKHSFP